MNVKNGAAPDRVIMEEVKLTEQQISMANLVQQYVLVCCSKK
jgi:hypothetical protein